MIDSIRLRQKVCKQSYGPTSYLPAGGSGTVEG